MANSSGFLLGGLKYAHINEALRRELLDMRAQDAQFGRSCSTRGELGASYVPGWKGYISVTRLAARELIAAHGGPEDSETLRIGGYYAGALVRAGRAREALPMLEQALPVWRKVFRAGNLSIMSRLRASEARFEESDYTAT